MKRKQFGFSLIELLIVVAIILVLAAIAIPNFLASRMAANESGAAQEVRAITTAETIYHTQYGIGYSSQLSYLGGTGTISTSTNALFLDSVVTSGTKAGYAYVYTPLLQDGNGNYVSYRINANPLALGSTGRRFFYSDQTALIHYSYTAPAVAGDPPL
jgi:prepilin-type N-terminal cleavage/methylation domain-containing protein